MKQAMTAAAALIGLAAVAGGSGEAHEVRLLAGTAWRAASVGGAAVPDGVDVTLAFDGEGRVAGSSGCNRFAGSYRQDGHTLVLGPLAATKMACPPPRDAVETAVFEALGRAAFVEEADAGRLTLFDAAGTAVMTLAERTGT
jgi:heat shock protein HslJ